MTKNTADSVLSFEKLDNAFKKASKVENAGFWKERDISTQTVSLYKGNKEVCVRSGNLYSVSRQFLPMFV